MDGVWKVLPHRRYQKSNRWWIVEHGAKTGNRALVYGSV